MHSLGRMGNNLKKLRKSRGWTHQEAADAMGVSRSQIIKLERSERKLTEQYIMAAARAFGVDEAAVFTDEASVPVVGYVGAGSEAHIYAEAQGPFDTVPGPKGSNEKTVAVEIRGDSLGAFFDHWLVFYDDRREPLTKDMIGRLCVVGLADGRVLVKKLASGQIPGRWTLLSHFEPPIYDAIVEWGAIVRSMAPR